MSIKIKFFLLLVCSNGFLYSQEKETQLILQKKEINIGLIELNYYTGPLYIKNPETFITGIKITKYEKDSITVFYKYGFETDYVNSKAVKKLPIKIFNSFIKEINKLDFEKINNSMDFNIYDGTTYSLNIYGEYCTLLLAPNAPDFDTKERGLEDFYNLCTKIWSYTKNEN
jgi:hypothetical protein